MSLCVLSAGDAVLEEYDLFGDLNPDELDLTSRTFYTESDGVLIESVEIEIESSEAVAPNPVLSSLLLTPATSQASNSSLDASGTTDEEFSPSPLQEEDGANVSRKRSFSTAFEESENIAGISVHLFLTAAEWANRELERFSLFGPLAPPVRKRQKHTIIPADPVEEEAAMNPLKKELHRNRLVQELSPDAHWDRLVSHSAARGILDELARLSKFTDDTRHHLETNITKLERKQSHLEQMVTTLVPAGQPKL